MKKYLLTIALFGILLGAALLIYNKLNSGPEYKADLAYSSFIKQVKAGRIERAEITGKVIRFRTSTGEDFETYNPGDPNLIDDLLATGGTAAAAAALVQRLGAQILEVSFLIELGFLAGRDKLRNYPVHSVIVY